MHAITMLIILSFNQSLWRFEGGMAIGRYADWTLIQFGISKPLNRNSIVEPVDQQQVKSKNGFVIGVNFPIVLSPRNTTTYLNGDAHLHFEWNLVKQIKESQYLIFRLSFGPYIRAVYEQPKSSIRWAVFRIGFPSFRVSFTMARDQLEFGMFWYRTVSGKPNFIGLSMERSF